MGMMCKLLRVDDPSKISQQRLQRFWREADTDGSGEIDFREFCHWYLKNFSPDRPQLLHPPWTRASWARSTVLSSRRPRGGTRWPRHSPSRGASMSRQRHHRSAPWPSSWPSDRARIPVLRVTNSRDPTNDRFSRPSHEFVFFGRATQTRV